MATNKAPKLNGLAGIGGGTILILIAKNLNDASLIKEWLILIAPSVSVALSYIWNFLLKRGKYLIDKWDFKHRIKESKLIIEDALNDKNISEEHKARLRKEYEELDILSIDFRKARIISDYVEKTKKTPANTQYSQ